MSAEPPELVYVIGSRQSSVVKIGRSKGLDRRLANLQSMSPLRLEVFCTYVGGSELEAALHRYFKDRRTHGEWFDMGGEDPAAATQAAIADMERQAEDEARAKAERLLEMERLREAKAQGRLNREPAPPDYFSVPREVPAGGGALFQSDPLARRVAVWRGVGSEAPLCEHCSRPIGLHSDVRPHACSGPPADGGPAFCLGYEGPLPPELQGYDLPGYSWRLWRRGMSPSVLAGNEKAHGVILFGPPAAGKDSVTRALTGLNSSYRPFERLKIGSGKTTGYRMFPAEQLRWLETSEDVIYQNSRYGNTYVIDRQGLDVAMASPRVPVVHLGQVAGVQALLAGYPANWLTVLLWCSRSTTEQRSLGRGDTDTASRVGAWNATRDDLDAHPDMAWDLTVDTEQTPPEQAAHLIDDLLHSTAETAMS